MIKNREFFVLLIYFIFFLFPKIISAQWLESTIYVPDSFSGVSHPTAFTYNTSDNKVYIGGESGGCLIVVDGSTNQKIAKIPVGSYTSALCYNSLDSTVYCANYYSNSITVINGASNGVITTIPVGNGPFALVHNYVNNKIYCACLPLCLKA